MADNAYMSTTAPWSVHGLYENIIQQTSEAIIFADRAGVIRVWNQGAEALFGFSAADAIGASLDLIIPQHLRQAHWAGFHHAIAQGRTQHEGQVRMTRSLHRDGRKLYVDMSFSIVTSADGTVAGSVAVARDAGLRRPQQDALPGAGASGA